MSTDRGQSKPLADGAESDTASKCKKCGESKPQTMFRRVRKTRSSACKTCEAKYRRAHYLANREHVLSVNRAWAEAHPDSAGERSARWYRDNTARHHELMAESYARNREDRRAKNRAWYVANKEQRTKKIMAWRTANPDKIKVAQATHRARHKEACLRRDALIRGYRGRAKPAWLTDAQKEEIVAIYREARRRSQETGTLHHVDHIVPIRGKVVCGLHVPWNLQILTAEANRRKSNRFALGA